jgi:hypothetical protein
MSDAQASPASPILQALDRGQRDEAEGLLAAASADKLEHGAERAATDDKGQSAADMARAAGHREIVQLLENL